MQQLRITPEIMRQRYRQYMNEHQVMNDSIAKLDNLLNLLQNEWEGKSSSAFMAQYQQLKPNFHKMAELIETIAMQLNQTANAMEQLDNDIAAKFN